MTLEPCISVIVPSYNEENTIGLVLQKILRQSCVQEIIVVDDCSGDQTFQKVQELARVHNRIHLARHESNRGKGAAIRTAIPICKAKFVLIQDADLEYNPDEYADLLQPLLEEKADVVFGSRFLTTRSHRTLYYWHSLGNRFLTCLTSLVTDMNLSDMETGYKVFRREIIQKLDLKENRFGFEPEVTIKAAREKARIYEVGISYAGRTYAEGKKIKARDGLEAIWCIVKYGLLRR
jgi:glycosyltransferase involved in cell wall biosynthesis